MAVSGITVIVVPTWAVWLFVGFAVSNIAQHLWKIALHHDGKLAH